MKRIVAILQMIKMMMKMTRMSLVGIYNSK